MLTRKFIDLSTFIFILLFLSGFPKRSHSRKLFLFLATRNNDKPADSS